MTSDTATARGRPRSADRTQAILETTLELLHTQGYDSLRMQDVADHAGVGLATIYRRWPAKHDLVADALAAKQPDPGVELTGDADRDLPAMLRWMAEEMGQAGEYVAGLMSASQEHEAIAESIRTNVCGQMREMFGGLLEQKLGDRPGIDLIVDAIPGVLLFRVGLQNRRVDPDEFADEVMALIDSFD